MACEVCVKNRPSTPGYSLFNFVCVVFFEHYPLLDRGCVYEFSKLMFCGDFCYYSRKKSYDFVMIFQNIIRINTKDGRLALKILIPSMHNSNCNTGTFGLRQLY